jgi:hypothetical protein
MKLSSGNSILDDIKEKTLEISRKSDSDYHMATRQYSVLSGHDLDKANEELQYIKIKNEEKQQEKEKNQKSNLEANEKSSSSEKSDKNVGEVYKKITRQLKVEGRINLN